MSFEESKKKILDLITRGNLADAFDVTNKLIEGQDDLQLRFNLIMDEFEHPPNNFDALTFRMRYQVFVSRLSDFMPVTQNPVDKEYDKLYQLLCTVDFETQTTYFTDIYPNKNVSAFLLYGENSNDVKWLYHQLLSHEGLTIEKPLCIDYTSDANNCFDHLAHLLYNRFKVSDKKPKSLRLEIELYLRTLSLVIIVKYPGKKIMELKGFYASFYELFSLLYTQVSEDKKKVIFLFIEDVVSPYDTVSKDYFLWLNDLKEGDSYSDIAIGETNAKIMDLAPIKKIDAARVQEWIKKNRFKPELIAISEELKNCCIKDDGESPYEVIEKLCHIIKNDKTKNPVQWLNY